MQIELLFIEGCPNLALARRNLAHVVRRSGIDNAEVVERLVGPDEQGAPDEMHGSPTILIDGIDVAPLRRDEVTICCRLYRTEHGITGAPTVDTLIDALASVRRSTPPVTGTPRQGSAPPGVSPPNAFPVAQVPQAQQLQPAKIALAALQEPVVDRRNARAEDGESAAVELVDGVEPEQHAEREHGAPRVIADGPPFRSSREQPCLAAGRSCPSISAAHRSRRVRRGS